MPRSGKTNQPGAERGEPKRVACRPRYLKISKNGGRASGFAMFAILRGRNQRLATSIPVSAYPMIY